MLKKIVMVLAGLVAMTLLADWMIGQVKQGRWPGALRARYEKRLLAAMRNTGYREDALSAEHEGKKETKEKETKGVDAPHLAGLQDFFLTMDPATGRVPKERLTEAWSYTRSLAAMKGKASLPVQWTEAGSDMGGRIRALAWDPNDAAGKKVWAGSATGGLWYNNDITQASSSWHPVDDFWAGLSVSSICFDPLNTLHVLAGTGEAATAFYTYRESSGRGAGIFESWDGGQTWQLMPSSQDFAYVNDILIRSESGLAVIYAGVVSGKYMGASHLSLPSDGLYRTADGGNTWLQVLPDITGENSPWAVSDIDLSADGRIFIGTQRNIDGKGGATILYSDSGLPGSWTVFDDYLQAIPSDPEYYLPGRVILACAPSSPNIVYAAIAAGYLAGWEVYRGKYILKTTNQGGTWTPVNLPAPPEDWATIAWHALTLGVDPNNANKLWAGALDVYNSPNAGNNWSKLSDWVLMYSGGGPGYIHADQHAICYKPGSSTELIVASDGGVFYTNSASAATPTFNERSKGLSTLQFYSCDIHPVNGSVQMMGGLQDNGSLWYTGTPLTINDMISGGDGAYCFYDKDDPSLMITSIYYNSYWVFNDGAYLNYINDYQSGYFVNPADYDYRFNTLYANAGPMFGAGDQDLLLRIQDIDGMANGQFLPLNTGTNVPFSHVKVSPNSTLGDIRVFLGSMSGRLFKVNQAQATPQVTEIGSPSFPLGAVSCVAVGHSDDTLLVTFSNYGISSVWQTYDGGQNWTEVEGNLPDMPVRWAIYHPDDSRQALIATELGVWSTSNLQSSTVNWQPVTQGMANVRVDMLKIRESDNTVCAGTHGRGLFTAIYPLDPSVGRDVREVMSTLTAWPNPAGDFIQVNLQKDMDTKISVYDAAGKLVILRTIRPDRPYHEIDLRVLENGAYFLSAENATRKGCLRFIKR